MAVKVRRCAESFSFIKKCYSTVVVKNDTFTEIGFEKAKPFDSIPGPKPLPIIGNLWRFFPGIGTYSGLGQQELSIRLKEEYGNIVMLKGLKFQPTLVHLYDPKDIETVCRNEGPTPKRDLLPATNIYKASRKDMFQTYGLFSSDGEEWQEARTKVNPIFMNPRTVKLYSGPIEKVANDFIKKIRHLSTLDKNQEMPENFNKEVSKFTLESLTCILLNKRLDLLDLKNEASPKTLEYLDDVSAMMDYLYKLDVLPSPYKYIWTPTYKAFEKINDRMSEFVEKLLEDAIRNLKNQKGGDKKEETILEKMIKLDKKYIFPIVCELFFAGVDTTSSTIKAWMYYMATNLQVQEKIRKEVMSALPTLDTPVTNETLEKMPYLRASIKEVLRLAPVATGAWRRIAKDIVVSGYQLPKGSNVILCFFATSRNEEFFPEPEKFQPERWIREDGKRLVETNPWVMQPFGFGVRSCIGKRLVHLELEQLFPKLVRNFKMEWHHPPPTFEARLMYYLASPLKIKMIPLQY